MIKNKKKPNEIYKCPWFEPQVTNLDISINEKAE